MSGAMFAVIAAAALTGGGTAYLCWALVVPLLWPSPGQRGGEPAAAEDAVPPLPVPDAGEAPMEPEVPMFPDPSLGAQIAAVRKDMAALAQAQIAMLQGMVDRESQLLNEMRAVASVRDPELLRSLQRIEARLSGRPLPKDGLVLAEDRDALADDGPAPAGGEDDDDGIPPEEVRTGRDGRSTTIGRA